MRAITWKTLIAGVAAAGCQVLGAWNNIVTALIILIVLDVITGFLRAFIQQELSSKESFRGIAKKVMIFALIAVACQVDRVTGLDDVTRNVVAVFYCASEGLSVVENSVAAGMPAPEFLREALKQLNERKFVPPRGDTGGASNA
jgi:toxin secretion/phage lysis holin